jgi:hypothetical protein
VSKHAPAERGDFAERDGPHSGPLKSEGEAADPAEKVEDIHAALFLVLGTPDPKPIR